MAIHPKLPAFGPLMRIHLLITIPTISFSLLAARPNWELLEAKIPPADKPAILNVLSYDFKVDFRARVQNHHFTNIQLIHPMSNAVDDWALKVIRSIVLPLQASQEPDPRNYRLKLKHGQDPTVFKRLPH